MKIPKVKTAKQMNAWFRKLSPANKRVAIATDVLDQITDKRLVIQTGDWIERLPMTQDNLLLGIVPACQVCALGAAMVASVRLSNTGEIDSDTDNDDIKDQLECQFTARQLNMIEAVFEKRAEKGERSRGIIATDADYQLTDDEVDRSQKFSRKYKDDTKRAVAIFKNIIANKGEFKP